MSVNICVVKWNFILHFLVHWNCRILQNWKHVRVAVEWTSWAWLQPPPDHWSLDEMVNQERVRLGMSLVRQTNFLNFFLCGFILRIFVFVNYMFISLLIRKCDKLQRTFVSITSALFCSVHLVTVMCAVKCCCYHECDFFSVICTLICFHPKCSRF